MLSHYRIPPNTHKRRQNYSDTHLDDNSNQEPDLKRPQKIELVKPNTSTKNKLKSESSTENHEIKEDFLDEILHNKNL